MPLSNDIRLYEDIRGYLDRAIASPKGIKISCQTPGGAVNLRQRLQKLRQLEKTESLEIYEVGDSRRATTAWDNLSMTVVGKDLLIEPRDPVIVEDL